MSSAAFTNESAGSRDESAAARLAPHPFWLDGGYDFESVQACPGKGSHAASSGVAPAVPATHGYKLPYIEAHTFVDSDLISLILDLLQQERV